MRANVACPHCGSKNTWYAKTETDLLLRCLCGFHQVLLTTLETAVIMHTDTGDRVKLPRRGTALHKTLAVLSILPGASSGEVTERLRDLSCPFTVSDVASYLTILRSKGLVETLVVKRGVPGGSTWDLAERARTLLCI